MCACFSFGHGVTYPVRTVDEAHDSLLGQRQRWMEEGDADSGKSEAPSGYLSQRHLVETELTIYISITSESLSVEKVYLNMNDTPNALYFLIYIEESMIPNCFLT